ncbi:hypothetical protein O6H91_01G036300 [Diphasiastrum complanatum]|uniref:Uncharacterized protein n=2 Tax=Diphasiastrum complanatum TaxID=34168 RepID=A0ACC2EQ46_DIPCM|nr:hypothetical protein O6H91_Y162800 [Diphasiastrum complanatum]KAJ7568525.1 hypothetical protein O6H91_01G036300 [Diphasiastrum complanatum]
MMIAAMPLKSKNAEKTPEKHHGKEWKASSRHASMGEYDSVSNNGSCSGESEDQTQAIPKEKQSGSPGLGPGSEKRDKIRWKNEKKHQRQKERRAKDLKDRSTGYLMSRKLEILAEQLVSMGFPSDRATMALILNEGHVESSVAWLLEGGDEQVKEGWKIDGDLKIDISEELARIAELEIRYKYQRIEVERAIVACQGDVDKAAEWLRDHHPIGPESDANSGKGNVTQEGSAIMQQLEHPSVDTVCIQLQLEDLQCKSNGVQVVSRHKSGEREVSANQSRFQVHASGPPLRNEARAGTGSLVRNTARAGPERLKLSPKSTGRVISSKTPAPVSQATTRSILSSVSLTANFRSSYQVKNLGESKQSEPKTSNLTSQHSFLSQQSSQASASGAHYTGGSVSRPSAMEPPSLPLLDKYNGVRSPALSTAADPEEPSGIVLKGVTSTKSSVPDSSRSSPDPEPFRPIHSTLSEATEGLNQNKNMLFSSEASFPPTSLEFSSMYSPKPVQLSPDILAGWGFAAPGGYVDWSMAAMTTCDYRTIDWSMPPSPSNSSETGLWGINKGLPTMLNLREGSRHGQDFSKDLSLHLQNSTLYSSLSRDLGDSYDIWGSSKFRGNLKPLGSQEIDSGHSSLEEWTSPFAGKDLFTLSHQAVSSPSL